MFYGWRVNSALAWLNIRPALIQPFFRHAMQRMGKQLGHSPQEIAVFIAAELPAVYRVDLNIGAIRKWIRERKINADDPVIREALAKLGLFGL